MSLHVLSEPRTPHPLRESSSIHSSGTWVDTNGSLSTVVDGSIVSDLNNPLAYLMWAPTDVYGDPITSLSALALELRVDTLPPAASGLRVALVYTKGSDISTETVWAGPVYVANGATQTDPDVGVYSDIGESLAAANYAVAVDGVVSVVAPHSAGVDLTLSRCSVYGRKANNLYSGTKLLTLIRDITDISAIRVALVVYSDGSGSAADSVAVTAYCTPSPSGFGPRAS